MFLKKESILFTLLFLLIGLVPAIGFAQLTIKGKVIYKTDATPAAFASIELSNRKGFQTMTNAAGNFTLHIANSKSNDSILISAVGYQSIKMPVYIAATRTEFALSEVVKSMESVTLRKPLVIGSMSESVGYYRSWSYDKTGGEIGRIFFLPHKKFKLDKVRFKAGNLCDTCLLRVHIRKVKDGLPAEEILKDSISIYVNHLSLDTKIPEFDLSAYDLTITENEFFVGIEVLNCGNGKKGFCSFSFAGTEKGKYIYKSKATNEWEAVDDYAIYLKLFLLY